MSKGHNVLTRALEFIAIFIIVPLIAYFFFQDIPVFALFAVSFLASLFLLHKTPDFEWKELIDFHTLKKHIFVIGAFFIVTVVGIGVLAWIFVPERMIVGWSGREGLLLRILALYPFLSALPQEIMYRALFFKRYGRLFRSTHTAILANACCFSLLHLFYQNYFAIGLTFLGGLVFAWAYVHRQSFTLAWILHALAGQIIFVMGLGVYFYHGAIG